MKASSLILVLALPAACGARAASRKIALKPTASYIDVAARRAELAHHPTARVREAIASLASCNRMAFVAAPAGQMRIPPHYLHGSHGPTNPAEAAATRVYSAFEHRIVAGMNRFVASGDGSEAQCAQDQIDAWARAGALLRYDQGEEPQSGFQTEWTLSTVACSESVLVNDEKLDAAETKRDIAWMNKVAHHLIGFPGEEKHRNNHHDWRGLAAMATGVVSNDASLFGFGLRAYMDAVNQIDGRGAFPLEMARSERSIHYQDFALQPLIPMAEFAERQGVPLYAYRSATGHTIRDAIDFLGALVANPSLVRVYTPEPQLYEADSPEFFAAFEFYRRRFPQQALPAAIEAGLRKPTFNRWLGGNTTVLAGR
ncbi:MAG: alginate lyase family protein [Acidobacteriota bacterium]